jgi:hypothetical protein
LIILALDTKIKKICKIDKEEEISESASRPLVGLGGLDDKND